MKTEDSRWTRLRDLFGQAMDLPPQEREAFIGRGCGDDPELHKELRELIATDLEPLSGPLTKAVDSAIHATTRDRRAALIGNVVGSYRLVSILGHGGAGTVYLAERADRQYSAQVAVKIVESALLHADIGHRFRAERQILASLNHPNIARLIDAGETPDGQPYLVMEYVHGQPIDRYCDEKQLSIEKRLELFLKVCSAVQYAHQNLIVHRDLKPANILVTADGTPKLLDFGIAKLLDTNEAAAALALTRVNDRILTPEYASPEQILGRPVTTTSDVYALGMVLFELLTGMRPYQVSATSQLELERSICITDPHRPSTMIYRVAHKGDQNDPVQANLELLAKARSIAPKRFGKELSGDIDAIVMRALRKEPDKRYGSVDQFIEDIRRHLSKQPVLARQGNWLYYSQRFTRRHTFGVSVTVMAVLVLIAFSVMTSIQKQRVATALDRATQERQRAETVSNFMLDVFAASDPFVNQGKEMTARELLNQAGRQIASDMKQQPQVRAKLLEAIGRAHQRQGQPDLAVPYLQDALRLERLFSAKNSTELSNTLTYLGVALRDKGSFDEARSAFNEAQGIFQARHEEKTTAYAQLLADVGRLEHSRGDLDSAQKYLQQALSLTRELYGNNHSEVAVILMNLSVILQWRNDDIAAEGLAREAVSIYRSTTPELHPDRVLAEYVLGTQLYREGKISESSPLIEKALEAQRKLYGENSLSVAATLDTLSSIREAQGKVMDAETLSRASLSAVEKSLGKDNFNVGYYKTALAALLAKHGNYKEAESQARTALDILRNALTEDHQYVASAEYVLADALLGARRFKEAESTLRANIQRWQRSGAAPWRAARSENALALALEGLQQPSEAERYLINSYRVLSDPANGASQDAIRTARNRVQSFYQARNEADKAATLLARTSLSAAKK